MRSTHEWEEALVSLAEWWQRPEGLALRDFLSHRLTREQETHLGLSPTDSVGIAERQGAERVLKDLLKKDFIATLQEHIKKRCQTTH